MQVIRPDESRAVRTGLALFLVVAAVAFCIVGVSRGDPLNFVVAAVLCDSVAIVLALLLVFGCRGRY